MGHGVDEVGILIFTRGVSVGWVYRWVGYRSVRSMWVVEVWMVDVFRAVMVGFIMMVGLMMVMGFRMWVVGRGDGEI